MEYYLLNEQDINEISWEMEHVIHEAIANKTIERPDDDFISLPIKIVLEKHEKLLDYLFNYREHRLNGTPAELIAGSYCFSSGEQLLIKIALNFYDGSGNALLRDAYQILDTTNFRNVLRAIWYERSGK